MEKEASQEAWHTLPGSREHFSGSQKTLELFIFPSNSTLVYSNNKTLIIKKHPFQEEHDITDIVKKTKSSIKIAARGNILSTLESCESLISVSVSSAIFETQLAGKPVISLQVSYDIGTPHILRINSCLRTTIEELSNTIRNLDDEKYRNNVVENASKLLPQNLAYVGHASEELLLFLKKLTMET